MRRQWVGRMSIALWTLWVAAVMVAPSVLRLCPTHDAPGRAALLADVQQTHPSGHAHHRADCERREHGGPACHCLGDCTAASAVALASAAVALTFEVTVGPPDPVPPAPRPPLTAPGHLLPFANGPPAARA